MWPGKAVRRLMSWRLRGKAGSRHYECAEMKKAPVFDRVKVLGEGAQVSVAVPYPTVASINQVVGWARASGFDGLVAHDVFDLGPDGEDETRTSSTTVVALRAGQIGRVRVLKDEDPLENGVRDHTLTVLHPTQRAS